MQSVPGIKLLGLMSEYFMYYLGLESGRLENIGDAGNR